MKRLPRTRDFREAVSHDGRMIVALVAAIAAGFVLIAILP